jgi:BolA family transcriptional regulator, general stress-responsive regulator
MNAGWECDGLLHVVEQASIFALKEGSMQVRAAIEKKLIRALKPTRLSVVDESHRHAGHSGARPEGETHFRVAIVSAAFSGLSRVARQRLVYGALAEELKSRVHALALETRSPEEDAGA